MKNHIKIEKIQFLSYPIHCTFCKKDCYEKSIFMMNCGHSFCDSCSTREDIPFIYMDTVKVPLCKCLQEDLMNDK